MTLFLSGLVIGGLCGFLYGSYRATQPWWR